MKLMMSDIMIYNTFSVFYKEQEIISSLKNHKCKFIQNRCIQRTYDQKIDLSALEAPKGIIEIYGFEKPIDIWSFEKNAIFQVIVGRFYSTVSAPNDFKLDYKLNDDYSSYQIKIDVIVDKFEYKTDGTNCEWHCSFVEV